MSVYETLLETANSLNQQVTESYKELSQKQSENDTKIQDIYHILEFIPLSAAETSHITKQLKVCLKLRRELKENNALLQSYQTAKITNIGQVAQNIEKNSKERSERYLQESKESFSRLFSGYVKKLPE